MMTTSLITIQLLLTLVANCIVWFLPTVIERKRLFGPQILIPCIFSSSYWFPILFLILSPTGNIPGNIVLEYIEYASIASIIAGIGYGLAYLLFKKQLSSANIQVNRFAQLSKTFNVSQKKLIEIISIFSHKVGCVLLLYCFTEALSWIGIGDRIYFYSFNPFWYTGLLPIAALFIGTANFLHFITYSNTNKPLSTIYVFFNTYFLIFLNGFDGGRRYGVTVLLLTLVGFTINAFTTYEAPKKRQQYNKFAFLFTTGLISLTLLSRARINSVGWTIPNIASYADVYEMVTGLLSPTPTIHVNTQMARYIDLVGTQGYESYFRAIGNTLFPEFLIGSYLFGEPLVTQLHIKFGWYGQDFGMLAEAIYSGGLWAAFGVHLILGLIVNRLYVNWSKGNDVAGVFYMTFIVAMLNSIRSDAMNFLKVWVYFGVVLFIIYKIFIGQNRSSSKLHKVTSKQSVRATPIVIQKQCSQYTP